MQISEETQTLSAASFSLWSLSDQNISSNLYRFLPFHSHRRTHFHMNKLDTEQNPVQLHNCQFPSRPGLFCVRKHFSSKSNDWLQGFQKAPGAVRHSKVFVLLELHLFSAELWDYLQLNQSHLPTEICADLYRLIIFTQN